MHKRNNLVRYLTRCRQDIQIQRLVMDLTGQKRPKDWMRLLFTPFRVWNRAGENAPSSLVYGSSGAGAARWIQPSIHSDSPS